MQRDDISLDQSFSGEGSRAFFVTDKSFTVLWMNQAAQQLLPSLQVQNNLFDVFPQRKDDLEQCVEKLENSNLWVCDWPCGQENNTEKLIIKKIQNGEKYLWYLEHGSDIFQDLFEKFSTGDEAGILQLGKIYRVSVFHIFNSLYSMREAADVNLINNIARNCYQIHKTTVNLEQYVLAQNHHLDCDLNLLSVQHLLEMTVNDIQRFSSFPPEKLEYRVEDKGILAMIDARLFDIALFNLLANAYEASVPEGKVMLTLSRQGDDAVISVSDEGTGIENGNLGRVFDPFFTGDADGECYDSYHLGLGLSVARAIIEAHQGSLLITSKQYHGTTVVIRIPCVTEMKPGAKLLEPRMHPADKLSDFYVFLADSCNLDVF